MEINFEDLAEKHTDLKKYLPIDFTDRKALICLNQAILSVEFGIKYYEIPEGYLVPRIP